MSDVEFWGTASQTSPSGLQPFEVAFVPSATDPVPRDFFPTPEQIQQEIQVVFKAELNATLSRWAEGYSRVGHRNHFLWNWVHRAVSLTTLPGVLPELREELCNTKALGVMLDCLWDDVADQGGDRDLLDALLSFPLAQHCPDFRRFSPQWQAYGEFAWEVWQEIMRRAATYPRYQEFRDLLQFDYLQLCNVMRYSHLLNKNPELLNLAEHDLYTPHNMHIMICSTLDLMCSPVFDRSELGLLREGIWRAQWMGRIGNLVTTWRRELGDRDFTSGVYARAVMCGHVTPAELHRGDPETIAAVIERGEHEAYYWGCWQEHRRFLLNLARRVHSVDLKRLVAAYERLVCLHLGSRGYK